jgi:uncharacterized membrane protein (DUF106 family)
MENFLDSLWFKTVALGHHIGDLLDMILGPLNAFGPAVAIFCIALVTVIMAKILTKTIKTKRYKELKKEFFYWYNLRQEASICKDPVKAKWLAKNIDQAKLNKAYYDFFLEGFLLSLATKYLPIFSLMAYVNEVYKPNNMIKLFGQDYIFRFGTSNGEEFVIGAVFWFIISVLLIYMGWAIVARIYRRYSGARRVEYDEEPASPTNCMS